MNVMLTYYRLVSLLVALSLILTGVAQETRAQLQSAQSDSSQGEEAIITEGFRRYLDEATVLWQGGGKTFVERDSWVALGVGLAPLKDDQGRTVADVDARTVARANANRELAKAIHGANSSQTDSTKQTGTQRIVESFRSFSREEVESTLRGTEVVGSWYVDGKRYVAVMVGVGSSGNRLFEAQATTQQSGVKFYNVKLSSTWRSVFRSRPGILTGGASLYRQGNETLILVVGKGRAVNNDPESLSDLEISAEDNAATELVQFVNGLKVQARDEVARQYTRLTQDEKTIYESVKRTVESIRTEKVSGMPPTRIAVGSWESQDGKYVYLAFAVKVSDLQ